MTEQQLPGGIPHRLSGLAASLLHHLLSLAALATEEGRLFLRQSLAGLLLFLALAVVGLIAYVALIACAVTLLAMWLDWGWPLSLAAAGLLHLGLAGILYGMLRARVAQRPFENTSAELRRDIEAMGNFSRRFQ